jgi:hypothetical protein
VDVSAHGFRFGGRQCAEMRANDFCSSGDGFIERRLLL